MQRNIPPLECKGHASNFRIRFQPKWPGKGKRKEGKEGRKALCGNSMQNGVGRWKQLADIGREGCMQGFQMTRYLDKQDTSA